MKAYPEIQYHSIQDIVVFNDIFNIHIFELLKKQKEKEKTVNEKVYLNSKPKL